MDFCWHQARNPCDGISIPESGGNSAYKWRPLCDNTVAHRSLRLVITRDFIYCWNLSNIQYRGIGPDISLSYTKCFTFLLSYWTQILYNALHVISTWGPRSYIIIQISCKSSLIYADFMLIIDMICKCTQSFTRCSLKGYTNVIYSYFNYTEICLIYSTRSH